VKAFLDQGDDGQTDPPQSFGGKQTRLRLLILAAAVAVVLVALGVVSL